MVKDIPSTFVAGWHLLDGVRQGISNFAGPTKIAAIIGDRDKGELYVFDEENILLAYKTDLEKALKDWKTFDGERQILGIPHEYCLVREHLIQIWFARCDPSVQSSLIDKWLGYGGSRFYLCWRTGEFALTQPFKQEMSNFSRFVIGDVLQIDRGNDLLSLDSIETHSVIDALIRISQTAEEGSLPCGKIAFIEPLNPTATSSTDTEQVITVGAGWTAEPIKLEKYISLKSFKHVSKTVRITSNIGCLLADGVGIYAISPMDIPESAIVATLSRGMVYLEYKGERLCRIVNGEFLYPLPEDPFGILTEALKPHLQTVMFDKVVPRLLRRLANIAMSSTERRHGCTLAVVDPALIPQISGQGIKTVIKVDDHLELVCSMAHVDGALVFDPDGDLHSFGAILHGNPTPNEDRSRGARYNSALRYSATIKDKGFLVVVSEDGPITVFYNGIEIYRDPVTKPNDYHRPGNGRLNPPFWDFWLTDPKPNVRA